MAEDKDACGANEAAFAYPGWRVTVASGIGVFVSFGSLLVYTFGIFLKPLTEEFAWSRQAVSLAFGIAAMALAAASPPLGYLIDRLGPRRIILLCLTTFGCAFASLALLTPHIGHLYAVFAILGLVGNGAAHLAYSRVVSTWFDRRRGMALAILMAGGALGAIFLPPAAQFFIDRLGWRGAFLILGALSLGVGLPVVARFVRERPGLRGAGRTRSLRCIFSGGPALASLLGDRRCLVSELHQPERSDDALGCTAHRPRGVREWRRVRSVRSWAQPVCWDGLAQDGCWTASLRRESPSGCLRFQLLACSCFRAPVTACGVAGCSADWPRDGWRSRHHSLCAFKILRASILLYALWLHLDGLCSGSCPRPGLDGPSVRRGGFLSSVSDSAFPDHSRLRRVDAADAKVPCSS